MILLGELRLLDENNVMTVKSILGSGNTVITTMHTDN